jgi:hypothetical protein
MLWTTTEQRSSSRHAVSLSATACLSLSLSHQDYQQTVGRARRGDRRSTRQSVQPHKALEQYAHDYVSTKHSIQYRRRARRKQSDSHSGLGGMNTGPWLSRGRREHGRADALFYGCWNLLIGMIALWGLRLRLASDRCGSLQTRRPVSCRQCFRNGTGSRISVFCLSMGRKRRIHRVGTTRLNNLRLRNRGRVCDFRQLNRRGGMRHRMHVDGRTRMGAKGTRSRGKPTHSSVMARIATRTLMSMIGNRHGRR